MCIEVCTESWGKGASSSFLRIASSAFLLGSTKIAQKPISNEHKVSLIDSGVVKIEITAMQAATFLEEEKIT